MQKEWDNLFSARIPRKAGKRSHLPRLPRGLRTPEDAFRRPILEALTELGGSGNMNDVRDRVGEKMKSVLNDHDQQRLPSQPAMERWRNNAQWCRNTLVQEGLMKADSPRGVWEISPKGKEALKKGKV